MSTRVGQHPPGLGCQLFAGVEFGLQPHLCHTAAGLALYCPYGLRIAVPAMVGEHLLIIKHFYIGNYIIN
jgi:cobalt/nickel transport system permease protein